MKNLLGRLHARSDDQRARIAMLWQVSVFGSDSAHHIARIYQAMTDIRSVRDAWLRLSDLQQRLIRNLVTQSGTQLTIAELAIALEEDYESTRAAAADLFFWGILATDEDAQELPIGDQPRVFVPGELTLMFRRLFEEKQAGDISGYSLRSLLELRDDFELETSATKWGVRFVPGVKRRQDVINEILDAIASPGRVDHAIGQLKQPATALWQTMQAAEDDGPQPFAEIVNEAGLTVAEGPVGLTVEHATRLRGALEAGESSLLVNHTWLDDGSRALFIPQELRNPGEIAVRVPLATIEPLPEGTVPKIEPIHPFALAWDVMTVLREISTKGPPVWVPGKELSSHWLRMINSRLWFNGEGEPPAGYGAFLLYLAHGVGALEPSPRTPGLEKAAIKPMLGRNFRWWRDLDFPEQTERLRQIWLSADTWIEGREYGEIEIRTADWVRFRHRLLTSVSRIDPDEWVLVRDASRRLAEQDSTILGDYFEVAAGRPEVRNRISAIAVAIEVELLTAFTWFGFVETWVLGAQGIAMRVTPAAAMAAREIDAVPNPPEPTSGPTLAINHEGTVHLRRPAPVHIWALTAFAENEQLQPQALYQLRPQSVGAALGAGFNLEQITSYLEQGSGQSIPDPLETRLREWTVGYKRVKLRRAVLLELDAPLGIDELRNVLRDANFEFIQTEDDDVIVSLPDTGTDGAAAEQQLATVLRKAGYVGLWVKPQKL